MKMRVELLFVLTFFANNALQQYCNVSTTKGHFYRKITKNSDEENNAHDEATLNPEFFDCGVNDSCTHVVKFEDTNTYQIVHGEAELKNIKRPVIVWKKTVELEPKNDWIVIQRRVDASVSFDRNWADYKSGFGDPSGNFWLGLDKLHSLAGPGKGAVLNITMIHGSYPNRLFYAAYTLFEIGNETDGYRLNLGGYSGNAGNSMPQSYGMKFSTPDRDNDAHPNANCASTHKSGWWYGACFGANLNSLYPTNGQSNTLYMSWADIHRSFGNITKSEMKIQVAEKSNNC